MSQFYLTLPSNSSMNYFPKNTLTNFNTKLHHEISLTDDWEVGLSDIILPKNWFNVDKNQYVVIKYFIPERDLVFTSNKFHVRPGYYTNIESLAYQINTAISRIRTDIRGKADENESLRDISNYITFHTNTEINVIHERKIEVSIDKFCELIFSEDLIDILGIKESDREVFTNMSGGELRQAINVKPVYDIRQTFYIYCDILENVAVGDTLAPLLRTIDVEGERGTMIHRNFDQPRYLPVQKKNFDTLEILIKDGLGREVPFDKGSLIVTLHFRRANTPYFLS